MGERKPLLAGARKRAVSLALYAIFSAIFIVSSVIATSSYSNVAKAQQDVSLKGAESTAEVLANGSLRITFTVTVHNPSVFILHVQSISWYVFLRNGTAGPGQLMTLSSYYVGPTKGYSVPKGSDKEFSFQGTVSDRADLSAIKGFINYSASQGSSFTLASVPYDNEFGLVATMGEYKHDYLEELYLNELVTLTLSFSSEAAG